MAMLRTLTKLVLLALISFLRVASAASPPQQVLATYVLALQTNDAVQLRKVTTPSQYDEVVRQTAGSIEYPILKALGMATNTTILSSASFSEFTSYKAEVTHLQGSSFWQFRLDSTGEMVAGALLLQTKNAFPNSVLGGDNSAINSSIGGKGFSAGGEWQWLSRRPPITTSKAQINSQAGRVRLAPVVTQDPCSTLPRQCGSTAEAPLDPRVVEFLFATDRQPDPNAKAVTFIADRQTSLSYGAASVRIPDDHKIGQLKLPSTWHLFGYEVYREKEDDKVHFSIKRLSLLSADDWGKLIREQGGKSALVFVHGFNTGFEEAIYRNAQIIWDLQYRGLSVVFSWSTKGGDDITDYLYDGVSAQSGRDRFIELISKLQNDYGIMHINVIAHSMGNSLVLDAMQNNSLTANPIHVDQLVMAAPDVDRTIFSQAIPKIRSLTHGMTLYASSADKALRLSAVLAKSPRAGDVPAAGPVVLDHLDTIDVTNIGDEIFGLNHTEFATNRAVVDDIRLLIDDNKRPPRLAEIRGVPEPPKPATYWKYVK